MVTQSPCPPVIFEKGQIGQLTGHQLKMLARKALRRLAAANNAWLREVLKRDARICQRIH
jgi:xanthosine utilization system XapX-like protein